MAKTNVNILELFEFELLASLQPLRSGECDISFKGGGLSIFRGMYLSITIQIGSGEGVRVLLVLT